MDLSTACSGGLNPAKPKQVFSGVCVIIATFFLMVNQRIGWNDESGANMLAIATRADLWYSLSIAFGTRYLTISSMNRMVRSILFIAPIFYIAATIFASFFGFLMGYEINDDFGTIELARSALAMAVGIIAFNLAKTCPSFASRIKAAYIYTVLINILISLLLIKSGQNAIPGFKEIADGYDNISGVIGTGGRFQGLASNPHVTCLLNLIAIALLIPHINVLNQLNYINLILVTGLLALVYFSIWTGSRAFFLILPMIFLNYLYLTKSFTVQAVLRICIVLACISVLILAAWAFVSVSDSQIFMMVNERMQSENGRLFLWEYYSRLLLVNPLGFGVGFESIVDTTSLQPGFRLPPHNAILQAGMYAGFVGVLVCIFIIYKILVINRELRGLRKKIKLPATLIGFSLAVGVIVLYGMFGGSMTSDPAFSVLIALLLSKYTELRNFIRS